MKATVIHCKRNSYDVLIDRRGPFGNKWEMKNKSDEERNRVIEEHKKWFLAKMDDYNDNFRYLVLARLSGKILGCWCKPKPCHGDTIVEWLNTYQEEK